MIVKNENVDKLNWLLDKYKLNDDEKIELKNIIYPIFSHYEFQKRMGKKFLHHGTITLGEHILGDAIVTYKLSKKYMKKHHDFNLKLAIEIAMLHDLYTYPWQNNKNAKTDKFFNSHGFRHAIEAVINSLNWYPELFCEEDNAKILIDGIVHHMFPLPVRVFRNNGLNITELKNFSMLRNLSQEKCFLLEKSSLRKKIGVISFSRSLYKEGRIMSKADKLVSIRQFENFSSIVALLTGHNRSLLKK